MLSGFYVEDIIKRALEEDIPYLDLATDYLIGEDEYSEAVFLAKAQGVVCGLSFAARAFSLLDSDVRIRLFKKDGDPVQNGDILAQISGKTKTLLKGERTALNILQHLSGIATKTARCVTLCEGTDCVVTETRKTLPGLRGLQKYAVTVGGGRNHRFCLSDAAMLKDNHIDAYGSLEGAVKALKQKLPHTAKIEVEARTLSEVLEGISAGADIIMLDNMNCAQMSEAVQKVRQVCGDKYRPVLEASGNITEENIAEVAATGVDVISLGALTHSVTAFDISMKIQRKTI